MNIIASGAHTLWIIERIRVWPVPPETLGMTAVIRKPTGGTTSQSARKVFSYTGTRTLTASRFSLGLMADSHGR